MGMLIHHDWLAQQNANKEPEVKEEIPFTEPAEPEEKPVRKTPTATRRRKDSK